MSSESVFQVASSWVDVGSFQTRLVVRFMTFTASVRNILDTPSYICIVVYICVCVCVCVSVRARVCVCVTT
jgi:hypothetical protein